MFFKRVELPRGERFHATAQEEDITLYFRQGKGIYRALCRDCWDNPFLEAPFLALYYDEACALPDGGVVERRNSTIKIREV